MATTQEQDKARGLKIVRQFYDASKSAYPFKIFYTFDELVTTLESRTGGKTYLAGLGLGATFAEMSDSDTYYAMKSLALKSGGQIPSKNGDFREFLINQATQVNFTDAVIFTATESAKDVVKGVTAVGDTLISTGKILNLIFIPVVLYFGYIYLNKKVRA